MVGLLRQWPFFTLGLIVTFYRLYVLYTNGYNLYADEAQYWEWSRHLALGYYSKPPMIAWLIALTTNVCGESEFCIRMGSPLLHFATSITIYLIGRALYTPIIAAWAMVVYITLPAVSFSSLLISTDPLLLLFWSISLLFFIRATQEDRLYWWALAGLAAGLGMLSKYNMLLFLPSAILYLIASKEHRHFLTSRNFWLAVTITLLIYTPNIFWNYQHGFVSYLHTRDISRLNMQWFHPLKLLEFLGAQVAIMGPVLFGVLAAMIYSLKKQWAEHNARLLLCFILPFLLVISLLSFLSKAEANWAAPIYCVVVVLVVAQAFTWKKLWLIYGSVGLHIIMMLTLYHYNPIASSYKSDPRYRLKGWQQMGKEIQQLSVHYPNAGLLFDERKTMAEMLYYTGNTADTVRKWNKNSHIEDHYDLTRDIKDKPEGSFLFISKLSTIQEVSGHFEHIKQLGDINILLYPDYALHYRVYYLENFKGY